MPPYSSGERVPATSLQGERYSAFLPSQMRTNIGWQDPQVYTLLEEAGRYLGELNAYSKLVPDIDYFIESHVAKEAEQSSRIEGTQTTLEEVYLDAADLEVEDKINDQKEVLNYIDAMNQSIEKMLAPNQPPLSLRLVCEAHRALLSGVRGHNKNPGRIRTTQNKIGGSKTPTLADATFIPPRPEDVERALTDLERFWHNTNPEMPNLIKVAYAHYQFETIHPFDDGNGRIGRLVIVLQLMSYGMLGRPVLYLSDYLEKNRQAYYDALMAVRENNNLEQWVKFFLIGISETSKKGRAVLEATIDLRNDYEKRIERTPSANRQKQMKKLLAHLYRKPVITAKEVETILGVTKPTAHKIVNELEAVKILKEKTGMERHRVYTLHEYLALFNN
jgi:Fic family protein